jgi:hypothetical protein
VVRSIEARVLGSRQELWCGGARYRLGYAWQVERLGGRPLSGSAAERVIARLLRGGDEYSVRSAYAEFAETSDSSRTSNDQILRWFSFALGGDHGGIGLARLVLVELDSSQPLVSQPGIGRPQDGTDRLLARCTAAGIRDLFHRGRGYRLAIEAQPTPSVSPAVSEVLWGQRAAALLTEIAENAVTPVAVRDLLREVARFMASTSRLNPTGALVLRVLPQGGAAAGATVERPPSVLSQRSTPSQLRRSAAPPLETTDWIEIRFVDDAGQPIAAQAFSAMFADGSTRDGTLDDSGSVRLDGVPPGVCVVEFPGFSAHVMG